MTPLPNVLPVLLPMTVLLRQRIYYLKRRVPRRYRCIEPRESIWISLKTDSREEAMRKAGPAWDEMVDYWEALLAGDTKDAERRYDAARKIAQARGYRFLPVERVAQLPLPEILDRVQAATGPDGKLRKLEAEALLGSAKKPPITVTRALEIYLEHTEDKRTNRDKNQVRILENSRKRAAKGFIDVCGNLPLQEIDEDHVEAYRKWWWERIRSGEVKPNTANREITQLTSMLRLVVKVKRLKIELPFAGLSFHEGKKKTRAPFSTDWIREMILAPGALDRMNLEARVILLGMINTGYRPGEGANLLPHNIRLDVDVPHIHIAPDARDLKTEHSERIIPLAGVSLEAFKLCPQGFARYRGNNGPSGAINKFLRENGLCETPEHTLYGFRHAFEDRLLEAGIDERLRVDFMGHKLQRERYGEGGSLEFKLKAIQAVAL